MDDSTLKPQAYASKDKDIFDDNAAVLASIILFNLHDSSEATDTDPFGDSSNTDSIFSDSSDATSIDSSIFDSSDASSIIDSSVFID